MKKCLAVLLSLCFVFSLIGCKGDKTTKEDSSSAPEVIGMPNPMVSSSKADMEKKLGFYMGEPKDAQNIKYFIYNKNLGEMQFKFGSVKMNARIKSETKFTDISGMYYTFEDEGDATVGTAAVGTREAKLYQHKGENETVQVLLWYDVVPGIMYSLSAVSKNLDGFDITAIANEVYIPMQTEVG